MGRPPRLTPGRPSVFSFHSFGSACPRGITHARQVVPLLLLAGLVWECLAPLWKAGAVFDPWDFLAYQVGGGLYLLLRRSK